MEVGGDANPAPPTPMTRDWSQLPLDALTSVFAKLDLLDILMGAGLVCHSWLDAAKVPSLWRCVDMACNNMTWVWAKCVHGERGVMCAMAKEAVDRSAGQLEVFIGYKFVDDDLLKYIGARAPCLKVLCLSYCSNVLNEGFVEAINKFPLLEELELSSCVRIGGRATYEAVGKACQNLKRLKVLKPWSFGYDNSDDDEAHGIATMHGLRSLTIYCSGLNNTTLVAILENCPHLEFLDLNCCSNIVVNDAMQAKFVGIKASVSPDLGPLSYCWLLN